MGRSVDVDSDHLDGHASRGRLLSAGRDGRAWGWKGGRDVDAFWSGWTSRVAVVAWVEVGSEDGMGIGICRVVGRVSERDRMGMIG